MKFNFVITQAIMDQASRDGSIEISLDVPVVRQDVAAVVKGQIPRKEVSAPVRGKRNEKQTAPVRQVQKVVRYDRLSVSDAIVTYLGQEKNRVATSRVISDVTGKSHSSVYEAARRLVSDGTIRHDDGKNSDVSAFSYSLIRNRK